MLSIRYESTEVDRRAWLHVPWGTHWSTSSYTRQAKKLNYKKRLLLRCIHHFKSDLIYNMDHMRISGNEPSSVIHRQIEWFQKKKILTRQVPKQAETKRDRVINP